MEILSVNFSNDTILITLCCLIISGAVLSIAILVNCGKFRLKQKTGKTKFEKFKDIMKELGFETMYEDDDTFGSKITGFRRRSIPKKMEELVVYGITEHGSGLVDETYTVFVNDVYDYTHCCSRKFPHYDGDDKQVVMANIYSVVMDFRKSERYAPFDATRCVGGKYPLGEEEKKACITNLKLHRNEKHNNDEQGDGTETV